MQGLISRLEKLNIESQALADKLKLEQKQQQILELEDAMQASDFWGDSGKAQAVSQEHSDLSSFVDFWTSLPDKITEITELVSSNTDHSPETERYLEQQVKELESAYGKNRLTVMMSGKYDASNAIFAIHAGAGGTDAQDGAELLLGQYLRYTEKHNLKTEILDQSRGSEAGIKSVTVHVKGSNAYGLLKSEAGVHRLVRQSPFNPAHTRETSFALLELIPELEEAQSLKLDPKDLEIEANTSSGAGGQSVNTTYSAIRITHKPTGIRVSIQNERSQHQNKEVAMKILLGKLQALEDEKLADEKKELRGEFKSAEWGNQIRSYVLHPYKMVKDHRTDYEESDPDSVLDGNLDAFVEKYLETQIK
ncbi:MAG TPA: peptide chain release factor 2 [Candidatus Doudnabacteria bacterium]|nr:peptide chain release factor 2 [Candidatus Doudnabacteria bacterium]